MSKRIKPEALAAAIQQELTTYHKDVVERVDDAGRESIKKLVKLTKASAPVGDRGKFRRSITSQEFPGPRGTTFVWGAKAPHHRLTHLVVHGHAKVNGGRTKGNPFLENAMATVLPEYEKAVREAIER